MPPGAARVTRCGTGANDSRITRHSDCFTVSSHWRRSPSLRRATQQAPAPPLRAPLPREDPVMAAWKLFGHDVTTEQLPAELRSILAQMQRERVAFEALTAGARDAARHLTQLAQPVAEAQKVVAELQGRVKALERLVPVLATLDEQTEGVSRTQRRTETQVEHTAEEVKTLRTEIEQLRATFDAALALKGDLTSLLESAGGLKSLRSDADTLTGQVRDLSNTFDRARQRQDELNRVAEAAAARLHALEERQQQVQGSVGAAQTRVTGLEEGIAHHTQAAADAADTKRQLGTLKSLA